MKNLRRISIVALLAVLGPALMMCSAMNDTPTTSPQPATVLPTGAVMSAFPKGVILPWYPGPTDSVPAGWARCDGQNGTPDLRGRYLIGAEDFTNITLVGNPVGQPNHRHRIDLTATGTGATSEQNTDSNWSAGQGHNPPEATGTHHKHPVTVTVPISGDTQDASNIPPSMKIQYIIKL